MFLIWQLLTWFCWRNSHNPQSIQFGYIGRFSNSSTALVTPLQTRILILQRWSCFNYLLRFYNFLHFPFLLDHNATGYKYPALRSKFHQEISSLSQVVFRQAYLSKAFPKKKVLSFWMIIFFFFWLGFSFGRLWGRAVDKPKDPEC